MAYYRDDNMILTGNLDIPPQFLPKAKRKSLTF
jgi:hypothetical protein